MPCFCRMRWNCLADLVVHPGHDTVQKLDDRHFRAEPPPDRAELEADDAGADDQELLRHLRRGPARPSMTRCAFRRYRCRAAGPHRSRWRSRSPLVSERLASSVDGLHRNLAGRGDAADAVISVDLVLLEQELDALDVAVNTLAACTSSSPADRVRACDLMPIAAKPWPASSKSSDACSSAFEGMQPTLRHVPPKVGSSRRPPSSCRAVPPGSRRHNRRDRCR